MMFEDDPPPFPSSATGSNKPVDVILTDLDDNNRLTAVADDEHFTLDDSDHLCSGATDNADAVNDGDITFTELSDSENVLSSTTDSSQKRTNLETKFIENCCSATPPEADAALDKGVVSPTSPVAFETSADVPVTKTSPVLPTAPTVACSANGNNQSVKAELSSECLEDGMSVNKTSCNNVPQLDIPNRACTEKIGVNCSPVGSLSSEDRRSLNDITDEKDPNDNHEECTNLKLPAVNGDVSLDNPAEQCSDNDIGTEQDSKIHTVDSVSQELVDKDESKPGSGGEDNAANEDDDFDDEFGDFAESSAVSEYQCTQEASSTDAETSAAKMLLQGTGDTEEWVADFGNADFKSSSTCSTVETKTEDLRVLNEFFTDAFWRNDTLFESLTPESTSCDVSGLVEQMNTVLSRKDSLNGFETLWLAISIVEEALALKFQWGSSSVFQHFLGSLNIDPKSTAVEKTNGLPVFARQLNEATVLQPVSSSTEPGKGKWSGVDASATAASTIAPVTASTATVTRSPTTNTAKGQSVPFDSLAVPPVQFDWNNSGLTNPLSSGSISTSSAMLDLGCLTTNDPSLAAGKPGANDVSLTLQKDLAALGIEVASTSNASNSKMSGSDKKTSLFEQIMKSEPAEHHYVSRNELSLDARALHDQLPDLDYMLSNVLLFSVTDR